MSKLSKSQWEPSITRMSDVQAEPVNWLWHPYIPLGKLTLLEGDPGLGKTWLAMVIAAAITRGRPLVDSETDGDVEPRNVIYMSAEDGLGDTLRPRLDAAGADPSRVYAITGKRYVEKGSEPLDQPISFIDISVLRKALEKLHPAVVIVDPLQAYLGAGVDMHRANEVRPVLRDIGDLAEEFGFAALLIRHLRKSSSDRAVQRGMGSIDFSAAARSVLLVAEDPDNENLRVLAPVKSSLALKGQSLCFQIRQGSFTWLGASTHSAEELLAPFRKSNGNSALADSTEWLGEYLAGGPVPSKKVKSDATKAGHKSRTIDRAKQALGVKSVRTSTGQSGEGIWHWQLPVEPNVEGPSASEANQEPGGPDSKRAISPNTIDSSSENLGVLADSSDDLDGDDLLVRAPSPTVAALQESSATAVSSIVSASTPTHILDDVAERLFTRAFNLITELAPLTREELRLRYSAARRVAAPPDDWLKLAQDNAVTVTVALTLLAEDTEAGLSEWPAIYLFVAEKSMSQFHQAPTN